MIEWQPYRRREIREIIDEYHNPAPIVVWSNDFSFEVFSSESASSLNEQQGMLIVIQIIIK